jgi:hypothetical protein
MALVPTSTNAQIDYKKNSISSHIRNVSMNTNNDKLALISDT